MVFFFHPFRHKNRLWLTAAAIWLAIGPIGAASTIIREPFSGITHIERTDWPSIPRAITANILIIDLTDPDLHFRLTEPHHWYSDDEAYNQGERTLDYLKRVNAQVAINAHFYVSAPGGLLDVRFLAVSNGTKYSKIEGAEPALNIDADNNARIVTSGATPPTYQTSPTVSLYNAVGGNERIVFQGGNVANGGNGTGYYSPRARTVAGLTQDNQTLVIITVDEGRTESAGVTPPESADLLIEYDVWDGLNFDGGGSTAMAMADPTARLVNVPSASPPRAAATNLAIFAAPIDDGIDDEEFSNIRTTRGVDEAMLSWTTRGPAAARVEFGETSLDRTSILLEEPATEHHMLLTGLDISSDYNYQLVAIQDGGDEIRSFVRPLDPAGDVIVDNSDPGAAFSALWNTNSQGIGFGPDYRFADALASPTHTGTYSPEILIPGLYTVSTWYLASGNRATNTPFAISHADGTDTVRVNQQTDGSQWRPLKGNLRFETGADFPTVISNDASGGDVVIADALRWKLTDPDKAPADQMPAWWASHYFADPAASPEQDFNGNGLTARAEYVFGTNPLGRRPGFDLRMTRSLTGDLFFEFYPAYPDRDYTLEFSTDLAEWTPESAPVARRNTGEARIVVSPPSEPRGFYRLKVTQNARRPDTLNPSKGPGRCPARILQSEQLQPPSGKTPPLRRRPR